MKWFLIAILFYVSGAFAQTIDTPDFIELAGLSPTTQYKTFETEHFILIYPKDYFHFSKVAAQELEHAHRVLSPLLKWTPRQKTRVLVTDTEDSANGFAMPALRVGMVLIATPPEPYFSTSYEENWIKLLVFHEYTHMLNIDPTTSWMEWMRIFFGDIIRPNGLWPVWMLEGLAVYYETKTSVLGRGRSPYYEGILRAYVQDQKLDNPNSFGITLDRLNGDFPAFPGGEIPYLFGYHLWQELNLQLPNFDETAGEYSLRSSHRVPFFINGNLENLTTHDWKYYWQSFVDRTTERMNSQLETVRKNGETQYEQISDSTYSATGGAFSADGNWMAWSETSMEDRAGLILKNLRNGKTQRIDDKILGVTLSFTADSRFLLYSALRKHKSYYLYSDLFAYELATGKKIQVTHGARAKDPHLSESGNKLVYIQNKGATNVLMTADLTIHDHGPTLENISTLYEPKEFSILGTPRFLFRSADTVVFSIQELGNAYSDLAQISLGQKNATILFHDGYFNHTPYPDQDGVFFASNKTGIENIYLLNKTAKAVTNVNTGVQFPFLSPKHVLHGSLITSNGIEIVEFKTSASDPKIKSEEFKPSASQSIASAIIPEPALALEEAQTSDYSPYSSLWPRQWAPIAYLDYQTDAGFAMYGEMLGFDATGKHQYFADAGYHFKTQTVDGGINYSYYGFRPKITLSANAYTTDIATDYYGRNYYRTYETAAALEYPIFWTYSSLRPRLYGFLDWNRIRDISTHAPVATSLYEYSQPITPGFGGSLAYSQTEESKLGFMPEGGFQLYTAGEAKYNERFHPYWKYLISGTSYHELFEHSVLQPKVKYVATTHHLGTENTSILLEGKSLTTINKTSVRGYSQASYYTHGVLIGSLDYHFPLSNIFSGNGTFPLFLKQMHGYVFGETAYVPSARYKDLYFPSAGGGFVLDMNIFVRLPISFVAQVENGFRKDRGGEFLISSGITAIPGF